MSPATREALRAPVVELAQRAGEAIMAVYRSDFAVEHKDDRSPLTEADLAAHRIIAAGLGRLDPSLPVLSEESAVIPHAERAGWRRYWLVDPLDGTREFVKRNGEFTVNIALIEDGEPTLGVIYAPALDELAHAVRGGGAVGVVAGGARELKVSPRRAEPWRVAGSRSHRDPRTEAFLARIGGHELLALGSSLKFCRLAAGELDVYVRYGPTSEWDTGAGQCILEEAGGRVTDLSGAPLTYNRRESLINPDFIASAGTPERWRAHAA
ncbi:MAG TPA: 3'(2'),5'-bisphosphate nucleotidase CysQ [Xanthomonadales bacterium]|nr:3'(2'),5'-bisphosphate nucleotidase CysQ [Xanthomonadales bacterium]